MKSLCFAAAILSMLPAAQQSFAATPAKPDAPQAAAMQLIETFPAPPSVAGRLDHITVDPRHIRIFVSALGNDSIEVFDFSSAKWLFSIKGMNTPKGILYVPQVSKLFVVNIGDNTLKVLDDSYHVIKTLDIGREADYIRYDPGAKKIMVGYSESQMVGERDNSLGQSSVLLGDGK